VTEAEVEIITAIQNLANTVIANAASRSLARYVSPWGINRILNSHGRMKSRAEYRSAFSSPTMLFRALHIISTQRYRLPVRRYIIDLFNQELNTELITTLKECSETLKTHPLYQPSKSESRPSRLSILGRLGRTRHASESDDEDDELGVATTPAVPPSDQPIISLQPVTKIVGFEVGPT
jgi:rapamycin-insensitive companion of mTOR